MSDDQPEWERILDGLVKREARTAAADVASEPRPAAVTATPPTISRGDIVAAWIDGRVTLCAVQHVRKTDGEAIVRTLTDLSRYHRLPSDRLSLCASHETLVRAYIPAP